MAERLVIRSRTHPLLVATALAGLGAFAVALIASDGHWLDKLQAWSVAAALIGASFLWGWRSSVEITPTEIVISGFLRRTVRINRSEAAGVRARWERLLIEDRGGRRLAKVNVNRWGTAAGRLSDVVRDAIAQ